MANDRDLTERLGPPYWYGCSRHARTHLQRGSSCHDWQRKCSLFRNLYQLAASVITALSRATLALMIGTNVPKRHTVNVEATGITAALNRVRTGLRHGLPYPLPFGFGEPS